MTFQFGYGVIEVIKFSQLDPSSTSDFDVAPTASSPFDIPQKVAIRAICFKVRGASRVIVKLRGDVTQTVRLSNTHSAA